MSKWILPAFHTHQMVRGYGHLGSSVGEILYNLFTEPYRIFIPYQEADYGAINTLFLGLMIAGFGGLYLCFLQPIYIIVLLVLFVPRYLTREPVFWFQKLHYAIELSPIFALAFTDFLVRMVAGRWKGKPVFIITFLCIVSLLNVYASSRTGIKGRLRHLYINWSAPNFTQRKEIIEAISLVPDNVSILVPNNIAPRLYRRDVGKLKVFYYDVPQDPLLSDYKGEYILCSFAPFFIDARPSDTSLKRRIYKTQHLLHKYIDSTLFTKLYHQKGVYLLRRIGGTVMP